jgi:hypothetical protein
MTRKPSNPYGNVCPTCGQLSAFVWLNDLQQRDICEYVNCSHRLSESALKREAYFRHLKD